MSYIPTRIPKRFWEMDINDYRTNGGTRKRAAREAVEHYIEALEDHREHGTGLTLEGPPGVGKTMLACIIGMRAHDKGYTTMYLPLAVYQSHLRNLIKWEQRPEPDWAEKWDKLQHLVLDIRNRIEFLLLDDVGKEHKTETHFIEDEFDFLVRRRYDLALPTIITTNCSVAEWYTEDGDSRYGEAMQSFAHEAFPPVTMEIPDFRRP